MNIRDMLRCGKNTYQIVWRGNSDVALDGAGVKPSYALVSFYVADSVRSCQCSLIFLENIKCLD